MKLVLFFNGHLPSLNINLSVKIGNIEENNITATLLLLLQIIILLILTI